MGKSTLTLSKDDVMWPKIILKIAKLVEQSVADIITSMFRLDNVEQ